MSARRPIDIVFFDSEDAWELTVKQTVEIGTEAAVLGDVISELPA